jgi:hypothetical protein
LDKIAKEKEKIFNKYVKSKKLSKEEMDFCETNDWHPVDELPLRAEFVKKIKKIRKDKYHKYSSVEDFKKDIEEDN